MNILRSARRGLRRLVAGTPDRATYAADGFSVSRKFVPFLEDSRFEAAWAETARFNEPLFGATLPDVRWRCHTCIWAARHGLSLEGDFAEFGVSTGILSSMILRTTDVAASGKRFFLFDTFEGIPEDMLLPSELKKGKRANATHYATDNLGIAKRVFADFPQVSFEVGRLPETIETAALDRLSYVSIDLNSAVAEMAVINRIWDIITPGAMIVLDDYGFPKNEAQQKAWDTFAASKDRGVLALPTGQGLLIR